MKYTTSLKKNNEFRYVYKNGTSFANKYLILYVIKNDSNGNRLGISVSKKVGNSIIRHRITRLIRESYRLNEDRFNIGINLVFIAREASKGKNFNEIESAVMHLSKISESLR